MIDAFSSKAVVQTHQHKLNDDEVEPTDTLVRWLGL
jgi:hypothetical protein